MTNALNPRAVIRLSLTDDATTESILSDIPLFCIGIMAFGISTFLLVLRKLSLIVICLHVSALFAFGAAILDLSQILARGRNNNGLEGSSITALINTREVGLALSVGFRFLFFWLLVAEPPRGERVLPPVEGAYRARGHSADWGRWGILGFLLKWSLLALTISIPIIQIIWRIAQRRFDVIYMVESTIEIVVSALFILKVMLNLFLSPLEPWWRPFRSYSAPLIGLLINLGIAVGNLTLFPFSETTLGRFLQAVELYIMILYLLIITFYPTQSRARSRVTSSFAVLTEKRENETPPPQQESYPIPNVIMGRAFSSYEEVGRPTSVISRIGSWILSRNPIQRPVSAQRRIWIEDVESGRPTENRQSQELEDKIAEEEGKQPSPKALEQPRTSEDVPRPTTGVSIPSYYDMEPPPVSFPPSMSQVSSGDGSDSPIYGLNGIIKPVSDSTSTIKDRNASLSSFDELLRQQTELDRSIAALKLFSSPEASVSTRPKPPPLNRIQSASTSSYTGPGLDSASARSEFSLSIFPEPPNAGDNGSVQRLSRAEPLSRASRAATWVPTEDMPSIPSSPNELGTAPKYDSAVTQYEITSFIGHLTIPNDAQSPVDDETSSVATAQIPRSILLNPDPPQTTARPIILPSSLAGSRIPGPAAPAGPRTRGGNSLNSRRLKISVPRPQADDSQTPGRYERPRRPPAISDE